MQTTDPGTGQIPVTVDTFDSSTPVDDPTPAHEPFDESVPGWNDHGGWEHIHIDDSQPGADHTGFDIF